MNRSNSDENAEFITIIKRPRSVRCLLILGAFPLMLCSPFLLGLHFEMLDKTKHITQRHIASQNLTQIHIAAHICYVLNSLHKQHWRQRYVKVIRLRVHHFRGNSIGVCCGLEIKVIKWTIRGVGSNILYTNCFMEHGNAFPVFWVSRIYLLFINGK